MWWNLTQQAIEALSNLWGTPEPPDVNVPPTAQLDPEPPSPWMGLWGKDPDVWEELCELQELWVRSDGVDRYWAGRRYRDAVGRLYPNAPKCAV